MAPPYMTVDEFGAYMMLFVFGFGVILFTAALILGEGNIPIAFIGFLIVMIIGLILSIYLVIKERSSN